MLAGVTDCRRSRKWGCRGRLALGFKPRRGSHRDSGPRGLEGEKRGLCGLGGEGRGPRSFGEVKREDHVALAEWGPHGGNTADGARSLNHGLLLLS